MTRTLDSPPQQPARGQVFPALLERLRRLYRAYSPFSYRIHIGWFGGIQIHPR